MKFENFYKVRELVSKINAVEVILEGLCSVNYVCLKENTWYLLDIDISEKSDAITREIAKAFLRDIKNHYEWEKTYLLKELEKL